MYPALHFDVDDFRHFKSLREARLYVANLETKIKESIDYSWGNSHIYITDIYGKCALIFMFSYDDSCLSLWNYHNGVSLGDLKSLDYNLLRDILKHVEQGETKCNNCGKWVKNEIIKHYSFAGGVCPHCYDPSIHLPPDTSGS